MNLLEIKNITKAYDGVKALDGLSLTLPPGQITALIGPNGAGKTTLFDIITGFLKPDSGEVYYSEARITGLPPHKIALLGSARTFQNIRLFPQMTVLENVMLAMKYPTGEKLWAALLRAKAMLSEDAFTRQRAMEYLEMVGMCHKSDSLGQNLSHGQRRLVELARLFAMEPSLFLLDEPMAGLFPEMIEQVKGIIRKLDDSGKTVFFIEHNIRVVMDLAERIIVINEGKSIADGSPNEIKKNPAVISAYLGTRKR